MSPSSHSSLCVVLGYEPLDSFYKTTRVKKSRSPRFQRGSWAGCIAQAHHRASPTTVTVMFPTMVRHHRREGPLNQGDPPCSFPPWPPGPRQGWVAGSDRFWLLELRVSQHFSTFYGSSVQSMGTQLNALP